MSEQWSWTYADADGAAGTRPPTPGSTLPPPSHAESWFGEVWHELADAGVASVTLHRDGGVVYGPMSLEAAP